MTKDNKIDNSEKENNKDEVNETGEAVNPDNQFKLKGKKLLFIIAASLLSTILIVSILFFTGIIKNPFGHKEEKKEEQQDEKAVIAKNLYYEMESMIVNLSSSTNKSNSFLKLTVIFEVPDQQTITVIQENLPKIKDLFNVYLRELRPQDLSGSAGIYLLREELVFRVNQVIYPSAIKDIFFKEMQVN